MLLHKKRTEITDIEMSGTDLIVIINRHLRLIAPDSTPQGLGEISIGGDLITDKDEIFVSWKTVISDPESKL